MILSLNIEEFQEISIDECLNYAPYVPLESTIRSKFKNTVQILKTSNYSTSTKDEQIKFLLEQILLKTTSTQTWISHQTKYNLSQKYLYTIIKKYLFIYCPELF